MRAFSRQLGLDPRFASMMLVLIAIWFILNFLTHGLFLSPGNLYNLSIQTCVIAVMACGMVFVIVARQIDLSIGSLLAFAGMITAIVQVRVSVDIWGWAPDSQWGWIASIGAGLLTGALVGAFQGWWVAWVGVPAFVVTLAGYLMYRGAAFMVADGQTISPLSPTYQMIGGGLNGAIGVVWSTVLGGLASLWVVWHVWQTRRQRSKYHAEQTPLWGDVIRAGLMIAVIAAFVVVMNAYPDPLRSVVDGPQYGMGIGIPVLILLAVVATLTFVAHRTRFGRYVFAFGGNPEAALLSGIPTKRLLVCIFTLMGALAGLAAIITTARLGSGANSMGQLAELYVIAAAVIGGTALAGGVGSIPGAVVGALMIQSLDNGMVLLDVASAPRQVAIGFVLIVAAWFDVIYGRRGKK